MSMNDKTEDTLVASIRRTRASAAKPAETPTPVKSAPRRTSATARKTAKPAQTGSEISKADTSGNYQSGKRVWPD